jgi:hypothetical protein
MNQKILSVGLLVNLTIAGTPIPADAGVWLRSGNPNGTPIARDRNQLQTNPDRPNQLQTNPDRPNQLQTNPDRPNQLQTNPSRPIRREIIRQICAFPDGVTLVCPR